MAYNRSMRLYLIGLLPLLVAACRPVKNTMPSPLVDSVTPTQTNTAPVEINASTRTPFPATSQTTATSSPQPMQTHPSDIPLIMNRGAPMNERCVAFNKRANEENITVYALPDPQSEVVALLWNWADILQSEQGWYKIQIPQGGEGWVQAEYVDLSLGCSS